MTTPRHDASGMVRYTTRRTITITSLLLVVLLTIVAQVVPSQAQEQPQPVSHDHHEGHAQAAPAQLTDVQARQFLPVARVASRSTAPTPTPPPAPLPPPPGGMEPITPEWVTRCPGNTVPFEAQGWWMNDFGHLHVGFCAPKNLTITGRYTFDTYLTMFHNPGQLTLLQAQIDSSSYGGQTVKVNVNCPVTSTCVWNRQVTMDASAYPYSGWHHVRIRATVKEPDGKELVATNFIPVYLDNGKPRKDWDSGMVINGTLDYVAGRGWYTGSNYIWSVIFSPPTASRRISGQYILGLRPAATDNPKPISYFVVKLDATHTSPGTILYETTSTATDPLQVVIDTTRLANGWHSIVARTESTGQPGAICPVCSGQPQMHAGDSKIWFYVQN